MPYAGPLVSVRPGGSPSARGCTSAQGVDSASTLCMITGFQQELSGDSAAQSCSTAALQHCRRRCLCRRSCRVRSSDTAAGRALPHRIACGRPITHSNTELKYCLRHDLLARRTTLSYPEGKSARHARRSPSCMNQVGSILFLQWARLCMQILDTPVYIAEEFAAQMRCQPALRNCASLSGCFLTDSSMNRLRELLAKAKRWVSAPGK